MTKQSLVVACTDAPILGDIKIKLPRDVWKGLIFDLSQQVDLNRQ